MRDRPFVFRGVFPAASLKRSGQNAKMPTTYNCRFPRGIPRGLIEATSPRVDRRSRIVSDGYVFRGVFPAASLKHQHLAVRNACGAVARGGFPRGIPRGLIEASLSPLEQCKLSRWFSAGYSPRPH